MKIASIISSLEAWAPPDYQESYDNAGLLTGNSNWECTGVLVTLDATEAVVEEAIARNCNLVVAHHPILFRGLKKITGRNYVERTVISAIKNDIALYAIHTNLDNILDGVNGRMADRLGLVNRKLLAPKPAILKKIYLFVPDQYLSTLRDAVFAAGAGHIGNYSECSFDAPGTGSFKAGAGTRPFVGEEGKRHYEKESKLEFIFPAPLETRLVKVIHENHPYEEPAYDIVSLANTGSRVGSGLVGELAEPMDESRFLELLKTVFNLALVRHTVLRDRPVQRVAICGGAGSFLTFNALAEGADFFVSADFKYHEFFDAEGKIVIADIGHFESEQFTVDLLYDVLREKFRNFAVLKSDTKANPVHYYL